MNRLKILMLPRLSFQAEKKYYGQVFWMRWLLSGLFFLSLFLPSFALQSNSVINIGVYNNPPLISVSQDNQVEGIFADILVHIANKEGWKVNYIPGNFNDLLSMLESEKIDFIPVVAFSDKRSEIFDFNKQNVLTNWAQLYTFKGSSISSLTDLHGKKIAVLKKDIHSTVFKQLLNQFGIDSEIVEVDSYSKVLQLISDKSVNAGVVNRFYGNQFGYQYKVVKSGVVFNPIKIHFAFPKNKNQHLRLKIDQNLELLKKNEMSMYYKSIDKWLGETVTITSLVPLLLAILFALILITYLVYLLFQYQPLRKALGLTLLITEDVIFNVLMVTLFIAILFWSIISYLDYLWFNVNDYPLIYFLFPMSDQNSMFYRLVLVSTILLGGVLVSHILLKLLRKQSVIEQSEQRFNLITRAGKTAVWDLDVKTGHIYLAPYLKQMLGYQDNEITNEMSEWSQHIHPEDRKKVSASIQQSLDHPEKRFHLKHRMSHKDGSVRWFFVNGSVISGNRTDLHIVGTHTDITNQKQAEDDLKRSELRFRNLFETSDSISVQGYDENRKVIYWNKASELLYGYTPEQAMGEQLEDLIIPANMKDQVVHAITNWVNNAIAIPSSELMLKKADGSPVLVFSNHVMLKNHNNKAEIFCIDIDLTESNKAQLALKESEQRFDMAMEVVNDGIWDWLLTENQVLFDFRYYSMAGYKPGAFPGKIEEWKKRLHRDDIKGVMLATDRYLAGESDHFDVEFRFLRQEGHYMWIRSRGKIVERDSNGVPTRFLGTHSDISLLKEHEEKILHQAHFDALTGLPNRLLTIDRLYHLILEANRQQNKVAVLFMDLDDFKKVNDTLGHEIGDKLLIETAQRLSHVIRSQDTVGRLGGDEFIMLMGGINDASDALPVTESVLNRLRKPFHIDGRELILSGSVGIALYPQDGSTSSDLLRNADSAMYHAKKLGRNTYSFFTESLNQQIFRRFEIEEQIHGALNRGEFTVFYQTKVGVSNSQIIGAEALLRWNNPVLGSVSPVEFIPIAEQTGLILSIGKYVLFEALQQTAQWLHIFSDFKIAVNLSPAQFRDPELVQNVDQVLKLTGVSGSQLELEITEGVLMNSYAYIDEALSGLKNLGVSIAMDDFGTGYSSLGYLRNYPFDVLKIDKSFVRDITIDEADRELINAAVAMAHGLKLSVVAEGVETQQQLAYLKQIGCDNAQGYLFSKPVSAEQFEKQLLQNEIK